MDRIWAPWRRAYVFGKKRPRGCLFCQILRASPKRDPKNLLVHRSLHSFMMLNLYPYTNGHLLVMPNRHLPSLESLNDSERLDFLRVVDLGIGLLKKSLHPAGFNIGCNLGEMGGAGVPGHVHLHVVPRWKGDTNFMPLLAGTKVISDSLQGTYQALRATLGREKKKRKWREREFGRG